MPKHNKGTFSNLVEKAKGIKILLALATAIIIGIVSFTAYFAKSSELEVTNIIVAQNKQEFDDYKEYQRLEYLDRRVAQFEERHACYEDGCRNEMPLSVWEEYTKKRTEKKRLENKLYPIKETEL
ncbi:hypothetical protein LCGC14_1245280 [marine sediment metagenome]|uniref:Uncharacterized protein n=1 Tax=marine sediment metagenome TaxID=412755 RepID=A0A0F9NM09_9ZZZZ